MWNISDFLKKGHDKKAIPVDVAWRNNLFDEIKEFSVKDRNGFQIFHTENPEDIYHFFKDSKIVKFTPWSAFCFEDDTWDFCSNFFYKFKQKKNSKLNKIRPSNREKIDLEHKKIKGQKSQKFY